METRLHTFQAFGTPKPLPRCVRGTKRSFYGRGHTLDTSCLACQTATRAARRHAGSRPWGAWPRAVGHQRSTRPSPGPRRSRAEAPSTCRRPRHSLCHHGSKQVARPMRPAPLRCMSLMATHISCKLQMSSRRCRATVDAMPTFPTEPHRTHATAGLHHEGVWQVPLVDNLNLSTA